MSTNIHQRALQLLSLIDLTSLNTNDTNKTIQALCNNARTKFGTVAAVCVYSQFIPMARQYLKDSGIKIATVVNFPHGMYDKELLTSEIMLALSRGTDEIDMVFPYHALCNGEIKNSAHLVKLAKELCGSRTLKVIIESGELKTAPLIRSASQISIENGADFIKTSTGKVEVNATLEAAQIILETIKDAGSNCGFKASGGIKTVNEASKYFDLASKIMEAEWVTATHFRLGASGLLTDILSILNNTSGFTHSQEWRM